MAGLWRTERPAAPGPGSRTPPAASPGMTFNSGRFAVWLQGFRGVLALAGSATALARPADGLAAALFLAAAQIGAQGLGPALIP